MEGKPAGYLQSMALDLKTGATVKQIQVARVGPESGTSGLQVFEMSNVFCCEQLLHDSG